MGDRARQGSSGPLGGRLAAAGRLWALLLVLSCSGPAAAPAAAPAATAAPPAATAAREPADPLSLASFDHVWRTVRDTHWDRGFDQQGWQAARDELRPQALAATSPAELRAIIKRLLARLKLSHYQVFPAEIYQALDPDAAPAGADPSAGVAGTVGMEIRVVGGAALVLRVEPGSPAAQAGIAPGWQLLGVGGAELAPLIATISRELAGRSELPYRLYLAVQHRLDGAAGSRIELRAIDGTGTERRLELERAPLLARFVRLGSFPPIPFRYERRRIGPDVGYIAFTAFVDPVGLSQAFAADLRAFEHTAGVILDLRNNPGGLGALAMGLGGRLVSRPNQSLGTMITRETQLRFVLSPQPNPYQGLVAVLIDGTSGSTAEILAAGLQALGRARVFGSPSAGAALPSVFERLPNGDGFQYAIAGYTSADGRTLEGRGVAPDELVPLSRQALLAGQDPVIEAAADWIRRTKR